MPWPLIILVGAAIIAIFLLKHIAFVAPAEARRLLREGALVVDVRSPAEFESGHLQTAINIPLDEIDSVLPARVADKSRVLLLHCQGGVRSGMARQKAKALGYSHALNLGSLSRARAIVDTLKGF